jgi:hypothetical protein
MCHWDRKRKGVLAAVALAQPEPEPGLERGTALEAGSGAGAGADPWVEVEEGDVADAEVEAGSEVAAGQQAVVVQGAQRQRRLVE